MSTTPAVAIAATETETDDALPQVKAHWNRRRGGGHQINSTPPDSSATPHHHKKHTKQQTSSPVAAASAAVHAAAAASSSNLFPAVENPSLSSSSSSAVVSVLDQHKPPSPYVPIEATLSLSSSPPRRTIPQQRPPAVGAYAVGGNNNNSNNNNNDSWNDVDDDNDGMSTNLSAPSTATTVLPPTAGVEVEAYAVIEDEDEETGRWRMAELEQNIHELSRDLATLRAQNATILEQRQIVPAVVVTGVEIDTNIHNDHNNNNNNSSSNNNRDPKDLEDSPPEQSRSNLHPPDHGKNGWLFCSCCGIIPHYLALGGGRAYIGMAAAAAIVIVTVVTVVTVSISGNSNPSNPPPVNASYIPPWGPIATTPTLYPRKTLLPTIRYNESLTAIITSTPSTSPVSPTTAAATHTGTLAPTTFNDIEKNGTMLPSQVTSTRAPTRAPSSSSSSTSAPPTTATATHTGTLAPTTTTTTTTFNNDFVANGTTLPPQATTTTLAPTLAPSSLSTSVPTSVTTLARIPTNVPTTAILPSNDGCEHAIPLPVDGTVLTGAITNATKSPYFYPCACSVTAYNTSKTMDLFECATTDHNNVTNAATATQYYYYSPTVWYVVEGNGRPIRVTTCLDMTQFGTSLTVYENDDCRIQSCRDDPFHTLRFHVVAWSYSDYMCEREDNSMASSVAWFSDLGKTYKLTVSRYDSHDEHMVGTFGIQATYY